jgi:uncharacterized protein YjgD (DUF1641 family)
MKLKFKNISYDISTIENVIKIEKDNYEIKYLIKLSKSLEKQGPIDQSLNQAVIEGMKL